MMNTLLLRLAGPMQSWGVQSHFGVRDTSREPSKSGVVGLLCAALGIPRQDTAALERVASLKMGVRVDCEGRLERDFQTAQNVLKASGGIKDTEISSRYYLAGAAFLVGFEGEDLALVQELQRALQSPHWPLYLGRKAFVPSPPVFLPDGLHTDEPLLIALLEYPFIGWGEPPSRRRLVLEDPEGEGSRPDLPLSFEERRFSTRRVTVRQEEFKVQAILFEPGQAGEEQEEV